MRKSLIIYTLMGVQGYSGNAAATARAPASLVQSEIPTKNSLPANKTNRLAAQVIVTNNHAFKHKKKKVN